MKKRAENIITTYKLSYYNGTDCYKLLLGIDVDERFYYITLIRTHPEKTDYTGYT